MRGCFVFKELQYFVNLRQNSRSSELPCGRHIWASGPGR